MNLWLKQKIKKYDEIGKLVSPSLRGRAEFCPATSAEGDVSLLVGDIEGNTSLNESQQADIIANKEAIDKNNSLINSHKVQHYMLKKTSVVSFSKSWRDLWLSSASLKKVRNVVLSISLPFVYANDSNVHCEVHISKNNTAYKRWIKDHGIRASRRVYSILLPHDGTDLLLKVKVRGYCTKNSASLNHKNNAGLGSAHILVQGYSYV